MAEPSTTQAILVGIERYADSNAIPDLNGPVNDVYRFCQWLRYRNVPPENISVFASPLDRNTGIVDEITSLINSKPLEATKDIVNKALREEARKKTASLFFLFWHFFQLRTIDYNSAVFNICFNETSNIVCNF